MKLCQVTRGQNTVAAFVTDNFSHLLQRDVFHEDKNGRNLVSEHVGIGRGCEPFACHRHNVHTIRQLIEEARVTYT